MKKIWKIIYNGILDENPVFRLVLGMCPTLAVTTTAQNGVGMGLSVIFVLTCSNVFVSSIRKFVPQRVRIPSYIIVIATFSTVVEMLVHAFVPSLYAALGIFLPLIVVNCIILGRAEAFASQNTVAHSAFDGIGMGIGFTLALTLLGSIREILGQGTWFGMSMGISKPAMMMQFAPGGFLTLGLVLGLLNYLQSRRRKTGGNKA